MEKCTLITKHLSQFVYHSQKSSLLDLLFATTSDCKIKIFSFNSIRNFRRSCLNLIGSDVLLYFYWSCHRQVCQSWCDWVMDDHIFLKRHLSVGLISLHDLRHYKYLKYNCNICLCYSSIHQVGNSTSIRLCKLLIFHPSVQALKQNQLQLKCIHEYVCQSLHLLVSDLVFKILI